MWPTLFRIGDFEVTTFGLMMFLGFVVGGYILTVQFRKYGLPEEVASSIVLAGAIGGILGGKIYYAALYQDWTSLYSRGGLVWYGGFAGGFLAASWVVLRSKVPYFRAADAASPAIAMGYCLGRIGCFLVGDDYGRPTDGPLGIAFPRGVPPTTADELRNFGVAVDPSIPADTVLKVHPTQLYEAGAAFLIFFILMRASKRPHPRGQVFALFLVLAGIERFLVEILRAKDDRFLGPFTIAQLISVVLVTIGIGLLLARRTAPLDQEGVAAESAPARAQARKRRA